MGENVISWLRFSSAIGGVSVTSQALVSVTPSQDGLFSLQ